MTKLPRCGAWDGKQCRATKDLTPVLVRPSSTGGSALMLPPFVVILLCPKHFTFKEPLAEPSEERKA
jgi:hypothetical protein